MKRRILLIIGVVTILGVLAGSVWAAGSVYYGPYGVDSPNCGTSVLCNSYGYALDRACQLSYSAGVVYYMYHINYGYSGYCDKSGGSGIEPGEPEPSLPYNWSEILGPILSMLVAGLILGGWLGYNSSKER